MTLIGHKLQGHWQRLVCGMDEMLQYVCWVCVVMINDSFEWNCATLRSSSLQIDYQNFYLQSV